MIFQSSRIKTQWTRILIVCNTRCLHLVFIEFIFHVESLHPEPCASIVPSTINETEAVADNLAVVISSVDILSEEKSISSSPLTCRESLCVPYTNKEGESNGKCSPILIFVFQSPKNVQLIRWRNSVPRGDDHKQCHCR